MEAEGITLGLNALISIGCAAGGAFAFWFKIKGSVRLLSQRAKTSEDSNKILHMRLYKFILF